MFTEHKRAPAPLDCGACPKYPVKFGKKLDEGHEWVYHGIKVVDEKD